MERKALGRGLAALIPQRQRESFEELPPVASPQVALPPAAVQEPPSGSYLKIPIDSIVPNRSQPRINFDEARINELSKSIKEKGVLVPLIVSRRDGHYELISGERRFRASRLAGLTEVPVLIREAESSERLELALIENLHREDLGAREEGLAYKMLMDQFGYSQEVVADRVGRDRSTVTNLLRLLKLPTRVLEAMDRHDISMGHARALLGVSEQERQFYFLKKVVDEGWSVRELEKRISGRRMIGVRSLVRNLKPLGPQVVQILDEMRRVLGTQIRLVPGPGKKGKILIDYYSEDDLDRIYRIVTRTK